MQSALSLLSRWIFRFVVPSAIVCSLMEWDQIYVACFNYEISCKVCVDSYLKVFHYPDPTQKSPYGRKLWVSYRLTIWLHNKYIERPTVLLASTLLLNAECWVSDWCLWQKHFTRYFGDCESCCELICSFTFNAELRTLLALIENLTPMNNIETLRRTGSGRMTRTFTPSLSYCGEIFEAEII